VLQVARTIADLEGHADISGRLVSRPMVSVACRSTKVANAGRRRWCQGDRRRNLYGSD
jgi:hypothetical protein